VAKRTEAANLDDANSSDDLVHDEREREGERDRERQRDNGKENISSKP
jgi:hypothetical protein